MSTTAAKALTTVGGLLGMVGVVAMAVGFKITLTPAMQEILFYKGLFAASAVLLVLGAVLGRQAHRQKEEKRAAAGELRDGADFPLSDDAERAAVNVRRSS